MQYYARNIVCLLVMSKNIMHLIHGCEIDRNSGQDYSGAQRGIRSHIC